MTPPDSWDTRMEILNRTQLSLENFLQVLSNHHDEVRPSYQGRLDRYIGDELGPGGTITMVEDKRLHPNALLAALLYRQIEFNKTVIQMLTDLDHRKSEPAP